MQTEIGQEKCVGRAVLRGCLGFTLVSVVGFSVWAFAGRWFYRTVGEAGLYAVSTIVFVGLSGLLLHPLCYGQNRLARFYKAFVPAFIGYAFVWSVCWFVLKFGAGEWLGSLAGCAVFSYLLGKGLGSVRSWLKVAVIMFIAHSAGYFAGGLVYMKGAEFLTSSLGLSKEAASLTIKLLWGVCYGLGFGAGIGYGFHAFQNQPKTTEPAGS